MLLGGWIESMYIATQLLYYPSNPDAEVVEKIAEQKYTISALLTFLKNFYDDPDVVYYTRKLHLLKNYFDSFEISFEKDDLEIDTIKKVLRATSTKSTITPEILNAIRDHVARIRTEMVTP
jgi:hypothetical protein